MWVLQEPIEQAFCAENNTVREDSLQTNHITARLAGQILLSKEAESSVLRKTGDKIGKYVLSKIIRRLLN